jgi:hypothetical protein
MNTLQAQACNNKDQSRKVNGRVSAATSRVRESDQAAMQPASNPCYELHQWLIVGKERLQGGNSCPAFAGIASSLRVWGGISYSEPAHGLMPSSSTAHYATD